MITPEKCVKHIMFTLHGCLRVTIAACFGPDQCALNRAIMTIIRGSFLEGHASEEGVGVQKKHPREISLDKIDQGVFPLEK